MMPGRPRRRPPTLVVCAPAGRPPRHHSVKPCSFLTGGLFPPPMTGVREFFNLLIGHLVHHMVLEKTTFMYMFI